MEALVSRPLDIEPAAGRSSWLSSESRASWMLILVTLLWGLSFVLMKNWQNQAEACPAGVVLSSSTLIAWRMLIALAMLALVAPGLFRQATIKEHAAGALIGCVFYLGFVLQVSGLRYTTPALSAFITSLGSAWVPVLAWLFFRIPVRPLIVLGLMAGVGGTALLAGGTDETYSSWHWGPGEILTLLSSILFAVEILLLDRLGKHVESAHITVGFMAMSCLLATIVALATAAAQQSFTQSARWAADMLATGSVLRDLILLGVVSTAMAFHWMNKYQPRLTPTRAALIYLLEPLFAALFAVAAGYDSITLRMLAGCSLILGGNLLVILPAWWARRHLLAAAK
jgi:drug/metabolite transporter (DMT)-like permease